MEIIERKVEINPTVLNEIFGQFDSNIKAIENSFNVKIVTRDDNIKISGANRDVSKAEKILFTMESVAEKGQLITPNDVLYYISELNKEDFAEIENIYDEFVVMTQNGRIIKPKTLGQKKYVELMKKKAIVLGIGPAGTGKTYLAMAMAIKAFKNNEVSRIILTRPAIEAGEKLGFLPGDLQQKVDPYLRPLYDALHEIMGVETFLKNMEKGLIEVAPLAYMRGRTLDNSYIVLDEAQNTTPEQMKMFLTRIGFGSKVVITGDITQTDLPFGKSSGLVECMKVLSRIDEIGQIQLSSKDVVRHPLVQKIIIEYEKYELKKKKVKN